MFNFSTFFAIRETNTKTHALFDENYEIFLG